MRSFAVAPDGQILYAIVTEIDGALPTRNISVVTGWLEEVRRVVTTRCTY